jgi:hypothetical protein
MIYGFILGSMTNRPSTENPGEYHGHCRQAGGEAEGPPRVLSAASSMPTGIYRVHTTCVLEEHFHLLGLQPVVAAFNERSRYLDREAKR